MDGGDPRMMLKYAGGVQDKTIINRIMLRFRPIAPKPVAGDPAAGDPMFSNKNLLVSGKRAKRKYVRVCKRNNNNNSSCRRRRRIFDEAKEGDDQKKGFVTLPLMPEKSDLVKASKVDGGSLSFDLDRTVGDDDNNSSNNNNNHFGQPPSPCFKVKGILNGDAAAVGLSDLAAVGSWVTVENVTDACMDEGAMGYCTDVERMNKLERDTCPGFVSDWSNRVVWVNPAFKNMVSAAQHGSAAAAVGLVVKDGLELPPYGAFSCRVRLQYGGGGEGKKQWKTVPCDVWRMSSGGFAWRLDVKAALSLGL